MDFHNQDRNGLEYPDRFLARGVFERLIALDKALDGYDLGARFQTLQNPLSQDRYRIALEFLQGDDPAAHIQLVVMAGQPLTLYLEEFDTNGLSPTKAAKLRQALVSTLTGAGVQTLQIASFNNEQDAFLDHPGLVIANGQALRQAIDGFLPQVKTESLRLNIFQVFQKAVQAQPDEALPGFLRDAGRVSLAWGMKDQGTMRQALLADKCVAGVISLKP